MKKILSLILAILGIGLLISCVGKIDLYKPISNDNNHTTTDNQSTEDNNTTIDDNSLYKHTIRLYYDGEDHYNDNIYSFDFSFNYENNNSNYEISDYYHLFNYLVGVESEYVFGYIDLGPIGELCPVQLRYDEFYNRIQVGVYFNGSLHWLVMSSDFNFNIVETVTLSVDN